MCDEGGGGGSRDGGGGRAGGYRSKNKNPHNDVGNNACQCSDAYNTSVYIYILTIIHIHTYSLSSNSHALPCLHIKNKCYIYIYLCMYVHDSTCVFGLFKMVLPLCPDPFRDHLRRQINGQDFLGNTPLHLAARIGDLALMDLVVSTRRVPRLKFLMLRIDTTCNALF